MAELGIQWRKLRVQSVQRRAKFKGDCTDFELATGNW